MGGCLVAMQPCFLPWAGYFNLIAQSDSFVFLDDVQLEKQSWQTRNKLLISKETKWISVPIIDTGLHQTIHRTQICDRIPWRRKLLASFSQNYAKHPHYDEAIEIVLHLTNSNCATLSELNEDTIIFICRKLGLTPKLYRSSNLNVQGKRGDRLVWLCSHFDAAEYLSPIGSSDYLVSDDFQNKTNTSLRFQNYMPASYTQRGQDTFISHLSIVDVIANLGFRKTLEYIA